MGDAHGISDACGEGDCDAVKHKPVPALAAILISGAAMILVAWLTYHLLKPNVERMEASQQRIDLITDSDEVCVYQDGPNWTVRPINPDVNIWNLTNMIMSVPNEPVVTHTTNGWEVRFK